MTFESWDLTSDRADCTNGAAAFLKGLPDLVGITLLLACVGELRFAVGLKSGLSYRASALPT
jgi:hypothetical protein